MQAVQFMYTKMAFTNNIQWQSQLQDMKSKAAPKSLAKIVAHLDQRILQLREQVQRVMMQIQSLFENISWLQSEIARNEQMDLGTIIVPFKYDTFFKDARKKYPEAETALTLQKNLFHDFEQLQETLQWYLLSLRDLEKQET